MRRIPPSFIGAIRGSPDEVDHPMAARGQERRQGAAHQSGRAGDGHRQPWKLREAAMCGQVIGELAVTIGEHATQRCSRKHRLDLIGEPAPLGVRPEVVPVAPPNREHERARCEFIHERPLLGVSTRQVLGYPSTSSRKTENGGAVAKACRLLNDPDRLPGRQQSGQCAGTTMPVEDHVDRIGNLKLELTKR